MQISFLIVFCFDLLYQELKIVKLFDFGGVKEVESVYEVFKILGWLMEIE